MSRRAVTWGVSMSISLLLALSTRSDVYWLPVLVTALCFLYALYSVVYARLMLTPLVSLSSPELSRGVAGVVDIAVKLPLWPPGLEAQVEFNMPESEHYHGEYQCITLYADLSSISVHFTALHVGVCRIGIQRVVLHDGFGLFHWAYAPRLHPCRELIVLPIPFDTWPIAFPKNDMAVRTTPRDDEELTAPSDTRAWRPGDPMKRIHWKLSARKRELLVRKFEEPRPNDTLVLCDPSLPSDAGARAPYYRDALLETTLSVARLQMRAGNPVRVPLRFAGQAEFSSDSGMLESALERALCRADFTRAEAFDRTLLLETRRAGRVGAVCAVTACLTPRVVDALCVMRSAGPGVRLLLVTDAPEADALSRPVARLLHHGIEVCPVLPITPKLCFSEVYTG